MYWIELHYTAEMHCTEINWTTLWCSSLNCNIENVPTLSGTALHKTTVNWIPPVPQLIWGQRPPVHYALCNVPYAVQTVQCALFSAHNVRCVLNTRENLSGGAPDCSLVISRPSDPNARMGPRWLKHSNCQICWEIRPDAGITNTTLDLWYHTYRFIRVRYLTFSQ